MSLIRCVPCRYSFEHNVDEAPTACPQCGQMLTDNDDTRQNEFAERQPTQELKTIPKPKDD